MHWFKENNIVLDTVFMSKRETSVMANIVKKSNRQTTV